MESSIDQVKRLIRECLGHDRWNSGLSDERLAEKIATRIALGPAASRPQTRDDYAASH